MTKRMKYSLKNVRFTKVVKIQDDRQLWSENCSLYKINQYALLDIALIASKQTGFRSNEC